MFPAAPSTARALVVRAHPLPESFNTALADAWIDGARSAGAQVRVLDVHSLDFNPALLVAHQGDMALEADLQRVQTEMAEAAHVTVAFPVWWGSIPATLKGLFDRVFLPGWAYAMGNGALPERGLMGRTGRLLVTMDVPGWYDWLVYRASARRQVQSATFHFIGIKPTRVCTFAAIERSTSKSRATMLRRARAAGLADGRALVQRFGAPTRSGHPPRAAEAR